MNDYSADFLEKKIFKQLRDYGPLCPGQLSANLFVSVEKVNELLHNMKEKSLVVKVDEDLREIAGIGEEQFSDDDLEYRKAWGLPE